MRIRKERKSRRKTATQKALAQFERTKEAVSLGKVSPRYPWIAWLDGNQHTLYQGVDYWSKTEWFRRTVYDAAERRNIRVRVQVIQPDEAGLHVLAIGRRLDAHEELALQEALNEHREAPNATG